MIHADWVELCSETSRREIFFDIFSIIGIFKTFCMDKLTIAFYSVGNRNRNNLSLRILIKISIAAIKVNDA